MRIIIIKWLFIYDLTGWYDGGRRELTIVACAVFILQQTILPPTLEVRAQYQHNVNLLMLTIEVQT